MARYEKAQPDTTDPAQRGRAVRKARIEAKIASGEWIYMQRADGKAVPVENTPKRIRRKEMQGYKLCKMESKTVQVPVLDAEGAKPVEPAAEDKPKRRRGPGRG